MADLISFRLPAPERELVNRVAFREGINPSDLIRRALRHEIEAPPRGELHLRVDPELAGALLDKAARMGRRSDELVEVLLRDHLGDLTDERVDPDLRRARARDRAKELLSQ